MAEYPTPRAVVLHSSGVFYDNGKSHPLADRLKLEDLSAVLNGAAQAFRGGEGVVMVDTPMPDQCPQLVADNWAFTTLKPWTTFVGKTLPTGNAVVHVGFLPTLAEGRPGALLDGATEPSDIAWRLGRYHALTGAPWRYTAGVSGCAALRGWYRDPKPAKQPLWRSAGPRGIRGAGPLIWHAADMPDPAGPGFVAMYDVNAMYLAALKNVRLAWGPLQHTGACAFDPDWPGYWEIDTADVPAELLDGKTRPPLVRPGRVHKGAVWLTTPMAKYLGELIGTLTVLDSWTCDNGQTIARPFAERLAAARRGDLGPMGPTDRAIKRTYAELVGMMGREGGSIYRPDWAGSTGDLGTANFLRRTDKAHIRPFEVRTDAAFYHVQDRAELERLSTALGVGTGPGTFKNPRVLTVAEHYDRTAVAA